MRTPTISPLALALMVALAVAPAGAETPVEGTEKVAALLRASEEKAAAGEPVAALATAREARALAPESPAPALAVGRLLARVGRTEEALEALAAARVAAPELAEGYLLAALLLRDDNRAGEGVAVLEAARDAGVVDPRVDEELALLLLRTGAEEKARTVADAALARHDAHAGLALAAGLARAGDPAERARAVELLERALTLGVATPGRVHSELGALLLEEGRAADALEHLRQARELMPEAPEVHYRLGTALRAAGDAEGARAALARFQELSRARDARERTEKEVGAALNEAQALAAGNDLETALARVETIVAAHPEEARALALRGKVLFSMGRREEALESVERARALRPERVESHYLEGMFAIALGRLEQSREALERALALDPSLGEAHELLALIAAEQADYLGAVEHFQRALELGADGPRLRRGYAEVLARLGRGEESERQMAAYRRLAGG